MGKGSLIHYLVDPKKTRYPTSLFILDVFFNPVHLLVAVPYFRRAGGRGEVSTSLSPYLILETKGRPAKEKTLFGGILAPNT